MARAAADNSGFTSISIVIGISISTLGRGGGAGTTAAGCGGALCGRPRASLLGVVLDAVLGLARAAGRWPRWGISRPMMASSCRNSHGRRLDPPGKAESADGQSTRPWRSSNALAATRLLTWLSASACRRCSAGAAARLENRFRNTNARSGRSSSTAAVAAIKRVRASPGHAAIASSASGRKPECRVVSEKAASSRSDQTSNLSGGCSNSSACRNARLAMALAIESVEPETPRAKRKRITSG